MKPRTAGRVAAGGFYFATRPIGHPERSESDSSVKVFFGHPERRLPESKDLARSCASKSTTLGFC
jgi:hypothetical protein